MKSIEQLEAERDELLAPDALPGTWTAHERDAYESKRALVLACLSTARTYSAVLDEWEPKEAVLDHYYTTASTTVLTRLGDELLSVGKPTSDYTRGLQQNLRLSLLCLHNGLEQCKDTGYAYESLKLSQAMLEAGLTTWRGGLTDAKRCLADMRHRIADARARLTWALQSDEERAKVEAESKARQEAFNALSREEKKARHEEQRRARGFGVAVT